MSSRRKQPDRYALTLDRGLLTPDMNRIREQRERRGLSRKELATTIGVDERTLRRWESNDLKRGLATEQLRKVADALQCSVEHLMSAGLNADTSSDVVLAPVTPLASAIRKRGLRIYDVKTDVVSDAGVVPGDRITVDETPAAIKARIAGDLLVLRTSAPSALILRQFLPPALITTNREGENYSVRVGSSVAIVGVVLRPDASDDANGDDDIA